MADVAEDVLETLRDLGECSWPTLVRHAGRSETLLRAAVRDLLSRGAIVRSPRREGRCLRLAGEAPALLPVNDLVFLALAARRRATVRDLEADLEASGAKVGGVQQALWRLRDLGRVEVAGSEPSPRGRPATVWRVARGVVPER